MTRSREVDPAVVARLSALPEPAVLNFFWLMNQQRADRLSLLLLCSSVVIDRPSDWDRARVRREHEQRGRFTRLRLDKSKCFGCATSSRQLYFHHIVEVQHGGSNDARNQVPLCFECHRFLHPWLTTEPAPIAVHDFESFTSVIGRLNVEEKKSTA